MLPNHYVIFWNGRPIGIDFNSGGYPYKNDEKSNPCMVKYFKTKEEAQKYWDIINWNGEKPAEIKEIQFRIVE